MPMRTTTRFRAGLAVSGALALSLTGCAPQDDVARAGTPAGQAFEATARASIPAGAPRPTGASIGAMSDQYAQPRRGPTAAAGASSWVTPSPPPAFVISTPLPPADPPAPPPAAVANREPAPRAAPAPPISAPAATPAAPSAAAAAGVDLARGRQLFATYGCGGCHVLADAGGSGGIGPALDGNSRLSQDYVYGAIAEGRGAMPAFAGQMSAEEITVLSAYIVQVARK
jgi:mono/diheme cytochrome c family protein